MKICSKCKENLPLTSEYFHKSSNSKTGFKPSCKKCRSKEYKDNIEVYKKHYENNKEKKAKYNKEYKSKNKELIYEYNKKYYEENKEAERIRNKIYVAENKERVEQRSKAYREENKELLRKRRSMSYYKNIDREKKRMKDYRLANREAFSLREQKRKSLMKKLDSDLTVEKWEEIKKAFGNECAYCGNKRTKLEKEHFIPISKGGEFTQNNIIPACKSCNSSKNNKDFFDWYPNYKHYDKQRENKILDYLGYKNRIQQLSIL